VTTCTSQPKGRDAKYAQRVAALNTANARRNALAEAKRKLRTGALPLADAMTNPPPELASALLVDVIRWTYTVGRNPSTIEEVGRNAIRAKVNLAMPLGRASAFSRAWVAEHGHSHWRPGAS
jgi:hypothetical protein